MLCHAMSPKRPTFTLQSLRAVEQFSYMEIQPEHYDKQCELPWQKQTVKKPVGWRYAFKPKMQYFLDRVKVLAKVIKDHFVMP